MPIKPPGKRNRRGLSLSGKRKMVAMLSLTAMVDMFTVLTVFLLQNYKATGQILEMKKGVTLPNASATKELVPAHVVIMTKDELFLEKDLISSYDDLKKRRSWMIPKLHSSLREELKKAVSEYDKKLRARLDKVLDKEQERKERENLYKVTFQADKSIDFLTVKKIMYTITEAGASEINFAVIQVPKPEEIKELEEESKEKEDKES